jgi:LacI family transcriptional regulator
LPTISDVAKRAGVSPVTVSRVINNAGNVSAATREKVERAVDELGYVPNVMARSLRSKRTHALALMVSDVTNPFWTTVARGVEDAARSHGYSVFLCNTDENPVKQQRYIDVLVGQRVDGVVIAPYDSDIRNLSKLRERDIPTVIVDRRVEGWDVDSVYGDSLSGAKAVVQHLINLGHRRIAMLSGPMNASTAEDRLAGYRMALAEAGISLNPRLIRQGEYRITSGEELTHQMLDEGLDPSAIFAANNAIAMGVIQALVARGLRIPQDIALVCFDDLPYVSLLFPFLTVVVQPAYDMGVNAAQLLLSRLDSEVSLQPRHVVLPTRLLVRHSCGSRMQDLGRCPLSLPLSEDARTGVGTIVKPLSPEIGLFRENTFSPSIAGRKEAQSDYARSDVNRLLRVLQHQEADRLPHLEFWVTSRAVYEYALERELKYDIVGATGERSVTPDDRVEFAMRLGMDAVVCDFSWRPSDAIGSIADRSASSVDAMLKAWEDADKLHPSELLPSLTDQLSHLERYLRTAQRTGVGVIASFASFFDNAIRAVGLDDLHSALHEARPMLERLMDTLLAHQENAMRVVCDRFADDLALVVVTDCIADCGGLAVPAQVFKETFSQRMKRLIAPAKEHGKLVAIHTMGRVADALPILWDIGFDAVHPVEPECNDIFAIKEKWAGKVALVGNIPTDLLVRGAQAEIEERVRECCSRLAPGGGYVLGSAGGIGDDIPPENFVAMVQAVHRYGRYGSLGRL